MNRYYHLFLLSFLLLMPVRVSGQGKFFDSNGVRIHYIDHGAGEPVMLVHSHGANLETDWVQTRVYHNLLRSNRVIALDCRGHGKSDKPSDPKEYGREMTLDIVRLLDHLNIRKVHIVGYSMGAVITERLLTTHPKRFLTATLGGGAGRLRWTAKDDERAEKAAQALEQGRLGLESRRALTAVIRSRGDLKITDAQAAAVQVPTLGIAGDLDPLLSSIVELKKLRPALKLVVISGATHRGKNGAIGRPEFVAAVSQFVGSHRQSESR
jgi:pimeloyl-ACP methyl ester carboxylesterase